jgi:hypothetical protein
MASKDEILEEQVRMNRLRATVDVAAYFLRGVSLSREEALDVIEHTRREVLKLCPGKEDVFDLILRPRFMRILDERVMTEWGVADASN